MRRPRASQHVLSIYCVSGTKHLNAIQVYNDLINCFEGNYKSIEAENAVLCWLIVSIIEEVLLIPQPDVKFDMYVL